MNALRVETFPHYIGLAYQYSIPLAGSIGRAVLIGEQNISPIRPDGSMRDIDIVNVAQYAKNAASLPDNRGFDQTWLSRFIYDGNLIYPGGDGNSAPDKVKVTVPVPHLETILEPVINRKINGLDCITLQPEAQLAIDGMHGSINPKSKQTVSLLKSAIESIPLSQRLDPELLVPFQEYGREVRNLWRRKFYTQARTAYQTVLPAHVKKATHPLIKKLARERLV